jgi:hypothetical protein
MSPRVRPTTDIDLRRIDGLKRRERAHELLKSGEAADLDTAYKMADYRTTAGLPMSVTDRCVYGESSPHSWFRDFAISAGENSIHTPFPNPAFGGPEEARKRLRTVSVPKELRDLSTTATAGGNFAPPGFIYGQFATAVRAESVLPQILPENTLPGEVRNETLFTPRITTGTSAAPQNPQNTAISETNIVESMAGSPIGTAAGLQNVSQQLLDHSNIDLVLATDLGRALGAQLDQQLIFGSGTNSQARGLVTVAGVGTTAYTDASPTQREAFVKILQAASDLSIALGKPANAILLHPRRHAWFLNWRDTATGIPASIPWPAPVYDVSNLPTTNGASTNEDFALVLRTEELSFSQEAPRFKVNLDVAGSNTLTARFTAYSYLAGLFERRPEAVQKISGTGFAAVVFS